MSGDEYVLDTPIVRAFVASVRTAIGAAASPADACEAIRPALPSCSPTPTGSHLATSRARPTAAWAAASASGSFYAPIDPSPTSK